MKIKPVILCGGTGSRLWPKSRNNTPKQFIYFGGWIDPKIIGYSFHKNLYVNLNDSPCGAKGFKCKHCDRCRELITPDDMYNTVRAELN